MKHLKVLEESGLVVARKSGREKVHFLNPVPIQLIYDRWIDKYTAAPAAEAGESRACDRMPTVLCGRFASVDKVMDEPPRHQGRGGSFLSAGPQP